MAGFNFAPINVPQQPQTSLADMIGIAKGAQAYQQAQQINPLLQQKAQQDLQKGGIDLEQAQRINDENIAKKQFFSDPSNFLNEDGKIDLHKINETLPKIAPLTAGDEITKYSTLYKNQAEAETAKRSLTKDKKDIFGSALGSLGYAGIQDPNVYQATIKRIASQYPEDKEVQRLANSYISTLGYVKPGAHVSQTAIKLEQELLNPVQIQEKLAPEATSMDTGAQIISTVKTKGAGGATPSITKTDVISGKSLAPQVYTTETGAPGIIGGSAGANVPSTPSVKTNQPPSAGNVSQNLNTSFEQKGGLQIAPGETYDAFKARSARLSALPVESNKALSMANPDSVTNQELTNNRILKLLEKPNVNIGPIAKAIADKTGGVGLNTEQMEVMKYLEQRIRNESARSNQDQASQRSAYGSFGTDKEALKDIIYNDKGLLASQRLYHQGVLNAQGNPNKPNLSSVNDFETKFNQLNQDPNVSHLLGIVGNKTGEQLTQSDKKHLQKMFGGMSEKQIKELFAKKDELLSLSGVK